MAATDEVPVLIQDLEDILGVLQSCEGFIALEDLRAAYLSGSNRTRESVLHRNVVRVLERVGGYVAGSYIEQAPVE